MGDTREHRPAVDWASVNLAASAAFFLAMFLHVGEALLARMFDLPVDGIGMPALSLAAVVLDLGLPFAGAFLLIRALDLAAPLKWLPAAGWVLLAINIVFYANLIEFRLALNGFMFPAWWPEPTAILMHDQFLVVRQALAVAVAVIWFWVAGGFIWRLFSGRAALHLPTAAEFLVAALAGVGLPAIVAASFLQAEAAYRERYAAQEPRFRELCRDIRVEVSERSALPPKGIFFDPNEGVACEGLRDGRCATLGRGNAFAEYVVQHKRLDFVEYWQDMGRGTPRALVRCDATGKCPVIAAVTATHEVLTRESQSKADEALDLRAATLSIAERKTGKVLGRLSFVYSLETGRLCAPGAEQRERFTPVQFVEDVLGLEARYN